MSHVNNQSEVNWTVAVISVIIGKISAHLISDLRQIPATREDIS